ncbi:MAG: methyltransferase domain-containing protein, partial [Oscillospiraceae bacterium]|nr:methyltransferase domain-containing protein [Oscillospiraceae bacterium]
MRMRKRKNLDVRLVRAGGWLVSDADKNAGHWREFAPGTSRLLVELGCGMGRFACETAAANPDLAVVALERVPDAIVIGMERARACNLKNIRFVLGDASRLDTLFGPGEIDDLVIQFCDPWPHWKAAPRRLVARNFLRLYRPLIGENGTLRFKTDNAPLFSFALKEFAAEGWAIGRCDSD